MRLAIIISHPIQHFCPQYASLAKHPSLQVKVFFASTLGFKKYIDPNFKKEISWGNLRLDEFDHVFLNGEESIPADKDLDAPALDDALTAFDPQLVMLHGYFQPLQRRAYNWAKAKGVRMSYISDTERRQKRNFLKECLKSIYLRRYFAPIDIFLTVGNANEAYYAFNGVARKKMVRMHFSIDRELYRDAYPQRQDFAAKIRARYEIGPHALVASVVGKLVTWKNQADIIAAMEKLDTMGIQLHLFIIGSGDTMDELKTRAAGLKKAKVHFPGFISPEELPAFYGASDIYIHPAAIEPHSLAISEAIYMGCPAIISDRCGSYGETDDVQPGKNGLVYRCGDIDGLVDAIRQLAEDPAMRIRFGLRSHEQGAAFQERSHGGFVHELMQKLGL